MLYATTRNQSDVYTAYKALHNACSSDGGLFVPFRLPQWDRQQLRQLGEDSFGQNVARVLKQFFSADINGWDVEIAIGRAPVTLVNLNSRLIAAECWHNIRWHMDHVTEALNRKLRTEGLTEAPNSCVQIAVSVAVLFGVFGELLRNDERLLDNPVDLAVSAGDMSLVMAAWYARAMGLPIGNIVCGCNANGTLWDLVHHGKLSTGDVAVRTCTPKADLAVPRNMERLICATLGTGEVLRFLECKAVGGLYSLEEEALEQLRSGLFASVISDSRVRSLLPTVYQTHQYILSPYTALAYGSLMDYRSRTQENRTALLIADRSPVHDSAFVAGCLDIPEAQLQRLLAGQ